MKAIQYKTFGHSDVIVLNDIEKPVIQDNEVLIRTIATTVNPMDMKIRSGSLQKGMPVELPYTPGLDVAGTIEMVGSKVTRLKKGDEVFATTFGGTYAEFINLNEAQVSLKPDTVSAHEAAALAIPLVTSYTILVEVGQVKAGQQLLVHGAAGGVGSVLVQMAKALGAHVIGTASGKGIELLKSYEVDETIDYKKQDFTKTAQDLDIVVDLVGGETQQKSFSLLKKGGKLLSTVMPPSQEMAGKFGITGQFVFSKPSFEKLDFGKKMVDEGKIKTQIVKTMLLKDAAKAQDLVSTGGVNGKIVLEIKK
jgi:NADPH:quinone reductase-like Zn-dependent oxidoreductase